MPLPSTVLRILLRLGRTGIVVLLLLIWGISVSLSVFCIINTNFLRPLPFPHPSSLVALDDQASDRSLGVSWGEVQQWERTPGLFDGAAAFWHRTWALTDQTGADRPVAGCDRPGRRDLRRRV
jgi:hypothetical protein